MPTFDELSFSSVLNALQNVLGENSLQSVSIALGLFLGVYIVLRFIKHSIIGRLKELSKHSKFVYDDVVLQYLHGMQKWFLLLIALVIALQPLTLPDFVDTGLRVLFLIAVVYQVIVLLDELIFTAVNRHLSKEDGTNTLPGVFRVVIKLSLWIIGGLLIISNLGIDITSLVAGLGIGGLAVSLALQNILSDLFSSFSIAVDKPFEEGDFIIIGDHLGTVKHIGMKSTRLTALSGEEIVISNAELTSVRVRNYKKMQRRRILFSVGVTYDTPPEKLKKLNTIIREAVESQDNVEFDRTHFKEFGDSALLFEVVYYMTTSDYNTYMDTQENINLHIHEQCAKVEIEMAFPTQTVYVKKEE